MPAKESFILTGFDQLVTLEGAKGPRFGRDMNSVYIRPDRAFSVRDGILDSFGTVADLLDQNPGVEVRKVEGGVVTPGLIDAHTHVVFGGNRVNDFQLRAEGQSYQAIAAAGGGIRSTFRMTAETSDEELLRLAHQRLEIMRRSGTRAWEIKSGYGGLSEQEIRLLRIIRSLGKGEIHATYLALHSLPEGFSKAGYLDEICQHTLPKLAENRLADSVDVFCEPAYFSVEECEHVLSRAKQLGFHLTVHADQLTRSGGAQLAAKYGARSADHLEQTDSAGIEALADAKVAPVLLPTSVLQLGLSKYPDARKMIEAGCSVVLATDFNPGSSPCYSLPAVMNLACVMMKMTPAEALLSTTVNAAHVLGLEDRYGTLEVGKEANFALWPYQDYREICYWSGQF